MDTNEVNCEQCKFTPGALCPKCELEITTILARQSSPQHLLQMLTCLFSFDFIGVIVEFVWSVQRLFLVGDYSVGGFFDQQHIKWRKGSY